MEQGCKLLKIVSILMIIFGAIGLLIALIALIGAGALAVGAAGLGTEGAELAAGLIMAAAIIMLIGAVIQLIAGIVGTKNYNKPEKAKVCIIFGVLVALVYIISIVFDIASSASTPFNIIMSIVIGLVMPVLYLIGAFKLKNMA